MDHIWQPIKHSGVETNLHLNQFILTPLYMQQTQSILLVTPV